MNAPMVVVQGDLLLPTLFPLAGMPSAIYGEEWTLTGTRPSLTEYEIPFYAARFLTAYVSALSLRNDRFPYTPASLWGKFKRNDEVDHVAQGVDAPPIVIGDAPQAVEPVSFAFEPFTASDDRQGKAPAANDDHHKQLAGGAIALACAGFIAWVLFGTKIDHQDTEMHQSKVVLSATPVVTPASDSEPTHRAGAPSATVVVAATSAPAKTSTTTAASIEASASRPAAIAALPSVQKPVVISGASQPPVKKDSATSTNAIASHDRPAAPRTVSERATKLQPVAQKHERHGAKAKAKSKRDARRYEVIHRRKGHEYLGAPVYRSTGHEAPIASPGRRTLARDYTRPNTANSSLSVTDMYNMLAHSAVLDDNSGASRQSVRAAPGETAALPPRRASAGETPSWNSDLNQRRVTDTPSYISK